MFMQLLLAPLVDLRPNGWNPNRMDAKHFEAEVQSILAFGFVDPITVRTLPADASLYEIVDGEHRFKGLNHVIEGVRDGRYRIVDDAVYDEETGWRHPNGALLGPDEGVPTLRPYVDNGTVPVVHLGTVSEAEARRLTLVLNETRGKTTPSDMAALLDEIEALVGVEVAITGLPLSRDEADDLLDLARREFDTLPETGGHAHGSRSGGRSDDGEDDEDAFVHRFRVALGDDGLAAVRAARSHIEQGVESGKLPALPSTPDEAWGELLVRLAMSYLDTHGLVEASES